MHRPKVNNVYLAGLHTGVYNYANTQWNVHTTHSDMDRVEVREVVGRKLKTWTWMGSSWNYIEIFIIVNSNSPAYKEQCQSSFSAAFWVQMLLILILSKRRGRIASTHDRGHLRNASKGIRTQPG